MAVPDRPEWPECPGVSLIEEIPNLTQQPVLHHRLYPCLNPLIQFLAIPLQAESQNRLRDRSVVAARLQPEGRDRTAARDRHLKRPHNPEEIVGMNRCRRLGIDGLE